MKSLRIRFAIGFSILFTLILGTALVIIYYSYADFRKEEFYSRLKNRAISTFKLLIEVDRVDYELLELIDQNTLSSLYEEKVLIYENNLLKYKSPIDAADQYDRKIFAAAIKDSILYTTVQDRELMAMHINQNGHDYILLASAFDKFGKRKLNFLKWMIIVVYVSGLLIAWMSTYFFVKAVIGPLDRFTKNIEEITSENLHTRIVIGGKTREIDQLAVSFNRMLERLQQSFNFQKDFVHYASHELRTPLTAMIGLTENSMNKKLTIDQHEAVLRQLFQQQQDLAGITNSLLMLSNKNQDEKSFPRVRLDELLFRSVDIARNLFPNSSIEVNLEGDIDQEENIMINANEALVLIAFNNLLKNAIQYSDNSQPVKVYLKVNKTQKIVEFRNPGSGFTEDEQQHLFTPFFRGSNTGGVKGHGLGLSLVRQIAENNCASIEYERDDLTNIFRLIFQDFSS